MHFVLDPIAVSDSAAELSFAARYGCLVLIENVSFPNFGEFSKLKMSKVRRFFVDYLGD